MSTDDTSTQIEELARDATVQAEFDITSMTMSRWDADPRMAEMGWPPRVMIRGRGYRPRRLVEQFKKNLIRQAIAERRNLVAA